MVTGHNRANALNEVSRASKHHFSNAAFEARPRIGAKFPLQTRGERPLLLSFDAGQLGLQFVAARFELRAISPASRQPRRLP
jgi:hypothetical protein